MIDHLEDSIIDHKENNYRVIPHLLNNSRNTLYFYNENDSIN